MEENRQAISDLELVTASDQSKGSLKTKWWREEGRGPDIEVGVGLGTLRNTCRIR
jgi:hypothetical protein